MKSLKKLSFISLVAFASLMASGCMPPSDETVNNEISYVRQRAYDEWKASRERGETKEPKLNGPLSLDDAVKLALRYNKELQIDVENREIARGYKKSAWGVILPSATISSSFTLREKGTSASTDSYGFGLQVDQPIWQGDKIPATLREAALYSAMVDQTIRGNVQTLVQNVAVLYYDILLHQHLLETHKEALNSAEAQLRMITEKRKQETATDYEVLSAQVDVANYRAKMISEQNAIDTARVALLKQMGCSQDSVITLVDKLTFLPMRPVFERAVQIATCNRADLRVAELDVRRQIEAVRIAESAFFPQFAATIVQNWSGAVRGGRSTFGRDDFRIGISGSYSIDVSNWGNLQQSRAVQIQKEIALLDAQDEALKEIRTEMNNLANAEESVNALVVSQDAAREMLRLVSVGYEAGVRTEVDVTTARKQQTDVMGQYYTSLHDHTKARIALQVAMGLLGPCYVKDGAQMAPNIPIADIDEFRATDYVAPQPFVSPSQGKEEEKKPRTRRRRTAGRDISGSIRDLRARDFGADDKDEKAEDGKPTVRRTGISSPVSRTPGKTSAPDRSAADLSPEERAKTFSEREAERERLQRERQRARDERLNRASQGRTGSAANGNGNGKKNGNGNGSSRVGSSSGSAGSGASAEERVREARQKAADIAAEAKQELQQLQRSTGTTSGDMKEAVRQAEEAIKGARSAVNDFDAKKSVEEFKGTLKTAGPDADGGAAPNAK